MKSEPLGVGQVRDQGLPIGTVIWERDESGELVALVRLTSPEPD